jgi:hypothetical protein
MVSDPVVGKDFFGREELLATIKKRVNAFLNGYRQNLALIGHAKLGKTSILHHFLHTYNDQRLVPIYVELKPHSLEYFSDQFIRSLLFQALRHKAPLGSFETLESLMVVAEQHIPRTAEVINRLQSLTHKGDNDTSFWCLFELTTILSKETGQKCVVFLDEFHRMGDFPLKNALQNFGKLLMLQKETLYIISSSAYTLARQILAEKLSLLFGNFESIVIKPFSFETSLDFINHKLTGIRISVDLKKYLISLSDGHPFFLDCLCRQIRKEVLSSAKIEADDHTLVEALKSLTFDSSGVLYQYFISIISKWSNRYRGAHLPLLIKLAHGANKIKALADTIKRSQRETSRQLKELMDEELIVKNGIFFHFHNKLLKFWLVRVYELKEFSLLTDPGSRAATFRVECHRHIKAFIANSQIDMHERVADLFRQFKNEKVTFDSRGVYLPQFKEVLIDRSTASRTIIAKAATHRWVCQLSHQKLTEKEILNFIQESAVPTKKRIKRVFMALNGMDHNAKLLAKNKKIWALNLKKINVLMEFYGRNKIVSLRNPDDRSQDILGHIERKSAARTISG